MLVCFIGHRNTPETDELKQAIKDTVVELIEQGADIFLFGSRSTFNDLCWTVVTELRAEHPHIKRVYVRAEYRYINHAYEDYLLQFYEKTMFPSQVEHAGRLGYVTRNRLMIDASDVCVFYYNSDYQLAPKPVKNKMLPPPKPPKSGTKQAYDYAVQKHKTIRNLYTQTPNF